jgi:hypothetical protein
MTDRRQFLLASLSAAAAWAARAPIKIAHREGNMLKQSTPGVYELAASIGGISGVEVQTVRSKLWDRETALTYKRESIRWNMRTVSMGGVMATGASLAKPATAEESIRKAIIGAEILGAGVVLVPAFRQDCPKMDDESSYGPVVELLKRLAPTAADAGAALGLELSLSLEADGAGRAPGRPNLLGRARRRQHEPSHRGHQRNRDSRRHDLPAAPQERQNPLA